MIYSEKVLFDSMQSRLSVLHRDYRIISVFPYEITGSLNSKYTDVVVVVYQDKGDGK